MRSTTWKPVMMSKPAAITQGGGILFDDSDRLTIDSQSLKPPAETGSAATSTGRRLQLRPSGAIRRPEAGPFPRQPERGPWTAPRQSPRVPDLVFAKAG